MPHVPPARPDEEASPAARPRRGRPRSEHVERAILDATLRLLDRHRSVAGITVEAVAHEAGVGKATIYRRWPGKEALVVAAVETIEEPPPQLGGRSLREDLIVYLESMRRQALGKRGDELLAVVLREVQTSPGLTRHYHDTVVGKRREQLRARLERGVADGELRDDLPMDVLMDLVTGPMLVRKLIREDASLDEGLPAQFVGALLDGLLAAAGPR